MYHVNNDGDYKKCGAASPESCDFYQGENDSRHYESVAEAKAGAEEISLRESGSAVLHSAKSADYDYAGMDPKSRTVRIAEDLESAIDEIIAGGNLAAYFDAMASNGANKWSFNNVVIAALQLRAYKKRKGLPVDNDIFEVIKTMDACGAKQWGPRGRKVTSGKGSALYIMAPMISRTKVTDVNGEPALDGNGDPIVRSSVYGYRTVAVFDQSQTEGEPIPTNPISLRTVDVDIDPKYHNSLKNYVEKLGYAYSERELADDPDNAKGTLAYVRPKDMTVVVDSRLSPSAKASALAHEVAHIRMGHTDDLAEYSKHRGRMETEAEGMAYMMSRRMGVSKEASKSFSPGYIAGWAKGNKDVVKSSLNKITSHFGKMVVELGWDSEE